MMIPEHKIEEILERTDIVQLVSRHVQLKKAGRSFQGLCPFHQEKSPSFNVTPERKRYYCFGCQAGGDAISFVQRLLGKTFIDAVRDLAKDAGVDLAAAEDPLARERQQLKEATDVAQRHFVEMLWHPTEGQKARQYLESRGVTEDVSRSFGLGWAPLAWQGLADKLMKEGMLEWGVSAGLVQRRKTGDGYYDMFRGRLIIPIRAPEGRTIAFGGRLLEGDDGPKYLNSKESRLYNKSETLYGMDQARDDLRKKKTAVLVEGYFDCIGMHQAGVKNAVALCSTALTPGHLGALARAEAKEIVLLLDGDEAGRKAVERLAGALLAGGKPTRVAVLPEGEDPDTFARKAGPEGVAELLRAAPPLTEHLFQTLLPHGANASFEEKMAAVERIKPIAAQLPIGLMRSAFFSSLSKWSGLPAQELELTLKGKAAPPIQPVPKPGQGPAGASGGAGSVARPAASPIKEKAPDPLEAFLVAAALRNPGLLQKDVHRASDELTHAGLRTVLAHTASRRNPEEALYEASDGVKRALEQAQKSLPREELLEPTFIVTCRKLKLRRIDEQLTHIAKTVGQVAAAGDLSEDVRKLQEERIGLLELKKQLLSENRPEEAGRK